MRVGSTFTPDAACKKPTRALAVRLAHEHPLLGPVLAGGGEVVFVETERAGRAPAGTVVLGVHDHAGDRSFVGLLEPGGRLQVEETPARLQLSERERVAAERIAAANERVRSYLGGRPMIVDLTEGRLTNLLGTSDLTGAA